MGLFHLAEPMYFQSPDLKVGETVSFAASMNTPAVRAPPAGEDEPLSPKQHVDQTTKELLHIFGLDHTYDIKVGNSYVRGVSGGERRRTSVAEVLTST